MAPGKVENVLYIVRRFMNLVSATNVGQKESGSCPEVVVEGVEACDGRVRCVGVVKVWVSQC